MNDNGYILIIIMFLKNKKEIIMIVFHRLILYFNNYKNLKKK
jgi:hypothetical protein